MQIRVFSGMGVDEYDFEEVTHVEITLNGVRFTVSAGDQDGTIDLRMTQTIGSAMAIEPQAMNAIRLRSRR